MRYHVPRFDGESAVNPDHIEDVLRRHNAANIRWHRPSGTVRFSHCDGSDLEGAEELDRLAQDLKALHPNCQFSILS